MAIATLTWQPPPGASPDGYKVEYREVGADAWTEEVANTAALTEEVEDLDDDKDYEYQVTALFGSAGTPVVVDTLALPTRLYAWFDAGDGRAHNHWERVRSLHTRYGGRGRSYVDRVPSANGVLVLNNYDLRYNVADIRINTPIRIGVQDGRPIDGIVGHISDVSETHNPITGRRDVTITIQGLLARLAQEDGRVYVYQVQPLPATTVVDEALRQVVDPRRIHVSPSGVLVAPSQIRALANGEQPIVPLLRRMELLTDGWMHEGRGGDLHFEASGHRKNRPSVATFEWGEGNNIQARAGEPDWFYNYLYTRVEVSGVQAQNIRDDIVLWEDPYVPHEIAPQSVLRIRASMDDAGRADSTIGEVQQVGDTWAWAPIFVAAKKKAHSSISIESGGQTLTTAHYDVELEAVSAKEAVITVTNKASFAITVTDITLAGRGVQRLTDYDSYMVNAEAEKTYNLRRTLQVGSAIDGSGYVEANARAVVGQFLRNLLARHSKPRLTGQLKFNPQKRLAVDDRGVVPRALVTAMTLLPSDAVTIGPDFPNFPAGKWYVEGGGMTFNAAANPQWEAHVNISQRVF